MIPEDVRIHVVTVGEAMEVLREAERVLGPDAPLILSLTASGIELAEVNALHIETEDESRYLEVRVSHPGLREGA